MQSEARKGSREAVQARPLAELLQCPPAIGDLLNSAAECLAVNSGDVIFRQGDACRGLYVVIAGTLARRTERLGQRIALAPVRLGELVELAAALGNCGHIYTLSAQEPGTLLLLPQQALHRAFEQCPKLRMQLLEELAREVSRGYDASSRNRLSAMRRRSSSSAPV